MATVYFEVGYIEIENDITPQKYKRYIVTDKRATVRLIQLIDEVDGGYLFRSSNPQSCVGKVLLDYNDSLVVVSYEEMSDMTSLGQTYANLCHVTFDDDGNLIMIGA